MGSGGGRVIMRVEDTTHLYNMPTHYHAYATLYTHQTTTNTHTTPLYSTLSHTITH